MNLLANAHPNDCRCDKRYLQYGGVGQRRKSKNEKAPHPWWTATMSLNAEGAIELEKTLSRR